MTRSTADDGKTMAAELTGRALRVIVVDADDEELIDAVFKHVQVKG